jgi:hypothetical protein
MSQIGITIESINFNGQSVDISFAPYSGGTINLGTQTIEGVYTIDIPSVPKTCTLTVGTAPSPTPSPTPTSTVTPTPTVTPSVTVTPTPSPSIPSGDADATAYLADVVAAGGTTNATIDAAVDTLFVDLKAAGVYSKLFAMYPMVGSTSASHAINATLDTNHDISWFGGWTFNASGSTANATNAYGNTFFNPQVSASTSNFSYGWENNLSRTEVGESYHGSIFNTSPQEWMAVQLSSGRIDWGQASRGVFGSLTSNNQLGSWFITSKPGSSPKIVSYYVGETDSYTNGNPVSGTIPAPDYEMYMGAMNLNGSSYGYNGLRYSFWYLSTELTQTELQDMETAINDFQTSLGRNTY